MHRHACPPRFLGYTAYIYKTGAIKACYLKGPNARKKVSSKLWAVVDTWYVN
ncbi:hypothetical protein SCLCIDRAFT_1219998 [Scleroderma citrinum Foug A]|uniref:Uncharacterized protein n=1 Tax=Scleroderma citrinum Foug A TaxID=1036808 RepID=A0A0C2ZW88_9AGAM|nr:hypothetical protein SCLCIDRAFT_1219998 [Scleroderma citrinum Foug A]